MNNNLIYSFWDDDLFFTVAKYFKTNINGGEYKANYSSEGVIN